MPQMAPILWSLIMLLTTLSLITFMMKMMFLNYINLPTQMNTLNKFNYSLKW